MRDSNGRTLREGDVCRHRGAAEVFFDPDHAAWNARTMDRASGYHAYREPGEITIIRRSGQPIDDVAPLWKDRNGVLIEVGCRVRDSMLGDSTVTYLDPLDSNPVQCRNDEGVGFGAKRREITVLPHTRSYRVTGPGELTLPEGWTMEECG